MLKLRPCYTKEWQRESNPHVHGKYVLGETTSWQANL